MTQPTPLAVAEAYLAVWNEADDARRQEAITGGWADDARYVDPMMNGDGHGGIGTMIAGARAHFPGHSFALRGTPDGHGPWVRFSWDLAPEGGEPVAGGTDMVKLDGTGRIESVVGFLDFAP